MYADTAPRGAHATEGCASDVAARDHCKAPDWAFALAGKSNVWMWAWVCEGEQSALRTQFGVHLVDTLVVSIDE